MIRMRPTLNLSCIIMILTILTILTVISSQLIFAQNSCVSKWSCEAWSECGTNSKYPNIMSRNCVDLNNCTTPSFTPETTKTCTPTPNCDYNWEPTEWAPKECDEDCEQIRSFVNKGTCKGEPSKSDLERACTVPKPILERSIPDISLDEDGSTVLDLGAYFSGEDLVYDFSLEGFSGEVEVTLSNNEAKISPRSNFYGYGYIKFTAKNKYGSQESNKVRLSISSSNDPPFIKKNIETLNIDEDSSYEIDLNDYFGDVDSAISFKVYSDNKNLSLSI